MPKVTIVCAAAGGLIGVSGITQAVLQASGLGPFPRFVTVQLNTAVGVIALAASFVVGRRAGAIIGAVVAALGVVFLVEYVVDRGFDIDELVVGQLSPTQTGTGRPSITVAAVFLVLGVARVYLHRGRGRRSQTAALVVLSAATLALLGFAYSVRSLYAIKPATILTPPVALAAAALSLATLATVEDGVFTWSVHGEDAGAVLVRRLLPLALLGLPVLGYLCLAADRNGVTAGGSTLALLVVLCALAVVLFTLIAARNLRRIDRRRERAMDELTQLREELTRQVEARARALERRGGQIAVLEDRQRIAADLHDIVIQRLFAAGMYLQSGHASATDSATRDRINTAVEAMDLAIRDLRNSIFELGSGRGSAPVDLMTAVDDLCVEASRILGFVPDAVVDDPDLVGESMREDLLAVVRESLSNIAKHAGAGTVEVELRADDKHVTLTVTDDGRGMTEAPHSSGTRNIADRARQRGGECVWEAVAPHGTRVRWQVPLPPAVP